MRGCTAPICFSAQSLQQASSPDAVVQARHLCKVGRLAQCVLQQLDQQVAAREEQLARGQ